ncbi:hypothetical protein KKI24_16655 [bacterium]|nr:hypothetical protein [bacterium]
MVKKLSNGSQATRIDRKPETSRLKRWVALAGGTLFFWVFAAYFTPWLSTIPILHPMLSYIEEYDINTTAYFYTDVEEFSVGNHMIQQLMTYPSKTTE